MVAGLGLFEGLNDEFAVLVVGSEVVGLTDGTKVALVVGIEVDGFVDGIIVDFGEGITEVEITVDFVVGRVVVDFGNNDGDKEGDRVTALVGVEGQDGR